METEPTNWEEVQRKLRHFLGQCRKYKWGVMLGVLLLLTLAGGYLARATLTSHVRGLFTQEVVRETQTVEVPAASLEERYVELVRKVEQLEGGLTESLAQSKAQREAFEHAIAEIAQQHDVLVKQSEDLTKALAKVPGLSSHTTPQSTGSSSENAQGAKVNINTATATQLDALPGIGPSYAERIVAYRNEHGSFQRVEDIQNVPGIGPATFAKIANAITV